MVCFHRSENFARSMAASLSAYLRAYVVVNLVSVEELSFTEFAQGLPSPTSLIALGMQPFDSAALLEINPSLIFPILEMLLGGTGKMSAQIDREMTEVEQSILEGPLRIILHDLRNVWLPIAAMEFSVGGYESEPQLSQILSPNEAVVAVSMDVHIGDAVGMMNIGIPSLIVKRLRQTFNQQSNSRKTQSTEADQARLLRLIGAASIHLDARLQGPALDVEVLLELKEGDILALDYPVDRPLDLMVNGKVKYQGEVVGTGRKRAIQIRQIGQTQPAPAPAALAVAASEPSPKPPAK
jgi:flagellar motor switch protein FliM